MALTLRNKSSSIGTLRYIAQSLPAATEEARALYSIADILSDARILLDKYVDDEAAELVRRIEHHTPKKGS
jgi:NAD(P)H-dependent FMN reductase